MADEKGVYCGKLLADMGADVIKIEPPGGDATREIPPFWGDRRHPEKSLFFLYTNTSKRGVTLDITRHEGQEIFKRAVSGMGQAGKTALQKASLAVDDIARVQVVSDAHHLRKIAAHVVERLVDED